MAFKEPTYEAVEVGETFGPLKVKVDEHLIKTHVFALDDATAWYRPGDTTLGGQVVPSAGIAKDLVALFLTKYDPNSVVGLHQKEEVWYHKPVRLGQTLTYTGSYRDKYQRRGKGYVVLSCEARDENNELVVRQESTEVMRIPENVQVGSGSADPGDKKVVPQWPAGVAPARQASADLAAGTPIEPLVKRAHQDQMSVFSGCGENRINIHTDLRFAQAAGFQTTLAQGMMETCWSSEMLGRFFGPAWLSGGWLKMIYLQAVYAGDQVTCKGVVKSVSPANGGRNVELEVWCEKDGGIVTAVGWASHRIG